MALRRHAPVRGQTALVKRLGIGLVPEMSIHLRAMDRFVTTGRPTCRLRQAVRVIGIPNENPAVDGLLLEMTFQTERRAAFRQHPLVD
jgi:hypothetical protein